ncbi:GAF domain-containing protein [Marivirga sericea]|uniref:GAF domain-containing protein n=1 Tax=Marivirga sericea TaxID=1028 RepID=A0A1X7JR04_9BACT|nr:GAF domain-containing protein [Marivirga sericea]SMG29935.1 GAF domain-containing protein [Marivirga sericea]
MKVPIKVLTRARCEEVEQQLKQYGEQIQNAISFIRKVESGELDIQFDSHDSENELAQSLLSMQAKMRRIAKAEQERNWAAEGLAKFSEILREDKNNLQDFSYGIISNLVKYLKANQGGLFIKSLHEEDNKEYLQLQAAYAYTKKKYLEKNVELNEGLVGQCYLEKDFIYMTDVPQDYVEITSGLGEATPSSILLFPLKINEEVFGVIELASFKEFEPYQMDFLKKLGENIASAISSVKIAEKTNKLLFEAQQQSEELQAQEEELRQNMEEIESTNEEMKRQRQELESKDKELKKVIAEMEANELDMQKAEDKNRKIVKDFLLLRKEAKAKDEALEVKDNQLSEFCEKIKELESKLNMRKTA